MCQYILGEVCQKGSLMALLEKTTFKLDLEFKYSIMKGIAAVSKLKATTEGLRITPGRVGSFKT
jgi:hypothetical protein